MNHKHRMSLVVTLLVVGLLVTTGGWVAHHSSSTSSPSGDVAHAQAADPSARSFGDYWFQGKAEVSRFQLQQERYGEIREGHAVLIFVTEDFLPEKQVKADDNNRARSGAWPILKVNFTRNFHTGVYPYSMMTSVFTPLDYEAHPRTLKTSTSVQEWCGHTYLQYNLRGDQYHVQGNSYFQSEGDQKLEIEATWLEEELFTRLRLDPGSLPIGSVQMIPGGQFLRIRHRPIKVYAAECSLRDGPEGVQSYKVSYPELGREFEVSFRKSFPHRIEGWREREPNGMETKATRTHTIITDYWNRNAKRDDSLREKLGL